MFPGFNSLSKKRHAVRLAGVLLILLVLTGGARAISPADYRDNLLAASESAEELTLYLDDVISGEEVDKDYETDLLDAIREELPATQKVELEGFEIDVDNRWVAETIELYLKNAGDPQAQRRRAEGLAERLTSVAAKIDELSRGQAAGRTKDEDKNKLAEILRRVDYQKPEEQSESFFARIMRQIRDWFRQKFPEPDIPKGTEEGVRTISTGLQILLYVLVAAFVVFLIYRFGPFLFGRFRGRRKTEKGERVILGETLTAEQDSTTLFDEADALARSGNLRGAIRKGYIAFLCELSDRHVIGLAQHKTNRDYLRDVRKKRELHRQMNGLTDSFERHWYGLDEADEKDWTEFKEIYQQSLKGEF